MSWAEHTAAKPCPVCHHGSWCTSSTDGQVTSCRRELGDNPRVDKSGTEYTLHWQDGAEPPEGFTPPEEQWRETPAEPEQRDKVFRALLPALPLSDGHLQALRTRGLTGDFIDAAGYATLPDDTRREAATTACKTPGGSYLLHVPGFYRRDGSKTTRLAGVPGLLIPVRNVAGQVVACVIRADAPGRGGKYRWLSAPKGTIGCGACVAVHVPLHEGLDTEAVRITEGQVKADTATALSGVLTIGLPGVGAWRLALEPLRELGAKRVLLAFDADARTNPVVARSLTRIALELSKEGFAVAVEVWPTDAGKGIDDVLAAERGDEIEAHEGEEAWQRIGEIQASAGAKRDPKADAKVGALSELDTWLARIEGDPAIAFSAEFLAVAAMIDPRTPEYERLRADLKRRRVRVTHWDREHRKGQAKQRAKRRKQGDWKAFLILSEKMEPKASHANIMTVLTLHPQWFGVIARNEFTGAIVFRRPPPMREQDQVTDYEPGEFADEDATRIAAWISDVAAFDPAIDAVHHAVAAVADRNKFHPIREYLEGIQWDGTPRLDNWLSTYLHAEDTPYTRAVGTRFLLSAVARVYEPGCQADCMLVLEGDQGLMKSTVLKTLFGESQFSDTRLDLSSKDALQSLQGVWCYEFGELESIRGKAATLVKGFISTVRDRYRPPYGRTLRTYPRQIVFCGTTNEQVYLHDTTGNRRFWPVRVPREADRDGIARDRDQLWAEAYVRYRRGESWHVDTPELRALCADATEQRETEDPWTEIISGWLSGRYSAHSDGVTTVEILTDALGIERGKQTKWDAMRAGEVLRALNWQRRQVRRGSSRVWVYLPPEPLPPADDDIDPSPPSPPSPGGGDRGGDTKQARKQPDSQVSPPSLPISPKHYGEKNIGTNGSSTFSTGMFVDPVSVVTVVTGTRSGLFDAEKVSPPSVTTSAPPSQLSPPPAGVDPSDPDFDFTAWAETDDPVPKRSPAPGVRVPRPGELDIL